MHDQPNHNRHNGFSGLMLAGVAMFAALGAPAVAQDEAPAVDDAAFVQGLLDMGLDEAVKAMLENPSSNASEAAGIRNALIDSWLTQQTGAAEAFLDAVEAIVRYHRKMLNAPEHADHWARAIWSADVAQRLLLSGLPSYLYAGDFALLGFPDVGQRRVVDAVAAHSYQILSDAEDEHFRLIRTLRADPQFVFKYVNTGYLDQMQRYMKLNVPYYRAWAIAYLLTQTDDGPYFSKQRDAAGHRRSLLKLASGDVTTLMDQAEQFQLNDDTLAQLQLLGAHLSLYQGAAGEAITRLDKGAGFEEATDYTKALIALTRAKAQQAAGQSQQADTTLTELAKTPFIQQSPLHRVIITDRRFMPRFQAAVESQDAYKKSQLLNEAFDVYVNLFNSGAIPKPFEGAVRDFVEGRYKDQIPEGVEVVALPPAVRFAKVRQLYDQAEQLNNAGQTDAAKQKYGQCAAAAAKLIDDAQENLTDSLHAEVLFYKGVSELRMQDIRASLTTFLSLAENFPATQRGEQAASVAFVTLAKPAYQKLSDDAGVAELYERSLKVLLEKYPTTDLAKLGTYDYAAFLREQGRYPEAVKAYDNVPENHPAYLNARYEQLACLAAQWSEAPGGQRGTLATRLNIAVRNFVDLAEQHMPRVQGDARRTLREHTAAALLIRAQMLNESAGRPDEAMKILQRVQEDYTDLDALKPRILGLTIRVRQKQGDYAQAQRLLTQYMQQAPDKAGPLALSVLTAINGEIKQLAAAGDQQDQVGRLAGVAVKLADDIVLPWARQQDQYTAEEQLAFEIMPARSLRAAGRHPEALQRYQAIVKKFGEPAANNIDVVFGLAEGHYHTGQLRQANKQYNLIIKNATEGTGAKDAKYWQAMMRIYQMMDQQATGKDGRIARAIDRLYRADKDLGGDPYKTELLRLRDKHAN